MRIFEKILDSLDLQESTGIDPFPYPIPLWFDEMNSSLNSSAATASTKPNVINLCSAVVDLTGDPLFPAYFGHHDTDMLYVASLDKICAMYAAFELRKRVQMQAKKMIDTGLSTAPAGWETQVYVALKKAWQPVLDKAFLKLPQGFPKLADIFVISPTGDVKFAEQDPALDLSTIGVSGDPGSQGKYLDWMKLMVAWSNDKAAGKCIAALSYPYINGVLKSAGFFKRSAGLWVSGNYDTDDWQPSRPGLEKNPAGRPLSAPWAKLQNRSKSNFTATALEVARFMTALAQGKLVNPTPSADMMGIMTHPDDGTRSFIEDALTAAGRSFTSIASKIGIGDDNFRHDCAIVRVDRGNDPSRTIRYVVVILGAPPNHLSDLRQLAVDYHDCIVALHP